MIFIVVVIIFFFSVFHFLLLLVYYIAIAIAIYIISFSFVFLPFLFLFMLLLLLQPLLCFLKLLLHGLDPLSQSLVLAPRSLDLVVVFSVSRLNGIAHLFRCFACKHIASYDKHVANVVAGLVEAVAKDAGVVELVRHGNSDSLVRGLLETLNEQQPLHVALFAVVFQSLCQLLDEVEGPLVLFLFA